MSVLLPGAEPFFFPGGTTGCLLSHGFTSSPQEVRGLGQHLASAGYTVLGIRLAGHGTRLEDMARTRWQDWHASLEDGYHILKGMCSRIILIGFSTGGALSLLLATEFPSAAVVAMSTPFALPPLSGLQVLYPFLVPLSWFVFKIPKGKGKWFDPQAQVERVAYDAYPLRAVVELKKLTAVMRADLQLVKIPALILHSKDDDFIPPDHATRIYARLGSRDKLLAWVEHSNHIITCDAAREHVYQAVSDFAAEHARTSL